MKLLLLILRLLLLAMIIILIVHAGFRILQVSLKFWYISVPALILIYLLISNYWKNKKAHEEFLHTPFHPYQEVQPEKETNTGKANSKDSNKEALPEEKQKDT
ncbi:MAG: hypothetical protein K0B81_02500 [Candidatus Cloacimonetes bacterium]|nr:hypothetical protein [Candidatus Cloacimonadota bacterium]